MRGVRIARAAAAVALAVAALSGCSADTGPRPVVYVTTNILGDVASALAGDDLEVVTLMPPGADPHSFEISARQVAGMRDAELVVANGLGLEEGLLHHVDTAEADGVPVFVAGDHVDVIEYDEGSAPDPHFWTDPAQMARVVEELGVELAALAGDGEVDVRARADAYLQSLRELEDRMATELGAIPREHRALVTNHHVFGYLARRFDVRILGAVIPGGTTLAAPSASDLQELVDAIDEAGVTTIFAESSQPDRLVQVLADEADRDVVVAELISESLAPPGDPGDTYLDMMRVNTDRLVDGLSP